MKLVRLAGQALIRRELRARVERIPPCVRSEEQGLELLEP